jgi:hypothetical protein
MTSNEQLEAYLREQGVPFKKQQHTIAFTAQDVAASEHLPSDMIAKGREAFSSSQLPLMRDA